MPITVTYTKFANKDPVVKGFGIDRKGFSGCSGVFGVFAGF